MEKTLRDEIAMSVLAGMHINALGVKNFGDVKAVEFLDLLATTAYRTADAMLRARDPNAQKLVEDVIDAALGLRSTFLAGQTDHMSTDVHNLDDAIQRYRSAA